MRFTATVSGLLAMAASVLGQTADFDPIYTPRTNEVVPAGSSYTITWTTPAKYADGAVSIRLIGGDSQNTLVPVMDIASGIRNSAESYTWNVDASLGADKVYGLTFTLEDQPSIMQYSNPFQIKGSNVKSTSTAASSVSSVTPSSVRTSSATTSTVTSTSTASHSVLITTVDGLETTTVSYDAATSSSAESTSQSSTSQSSASQSSAAQSSNAHTTESDNKITSMPNVASTTAAAQPTNPNTHMVNKGIGSTTFSAVTTTALQPLSYPSGAVSGSLSLHPSNSSTMAPIAHARAASVVGASSLGVFAGILAVIFFAL